MTKKHIYVLWGGWCSPQVFLATVPHFANWRNQPPHRNYVGGCNYMGLLMIVHIRCRMLHVFITFLICSPCRRYWRASRALSWAGAQSHGTTSLATTCRQQQQQPFKHKVSICSLPLWLWAKGAEACQACARSAGLLATRLASEMAANLPGRSSTAPRDHSSLKTWPTIRRGLQERACGGTACQTKVQLFQCPVQWVAWVVWISLHRPGGSCKMSCDTRQPPGGCCMVLAVCLSPRRTLPGWATLPKTPFTSP